MSELVSLPPKRMSKGAAFGWLIAVGALLLLLVAIPFLLLREQCVLFAKIQYNGPGNYFVVPEVDYPAAPSTGEVESFELDGIRFSLPVDSIESVSLDEPPDGRVTIQLRNGVTVAIDRPATGPQVPPETVDHPTLTSEEGFRTYVASPGEFSWGASAEETRRLDRALAKKQAWPFVEDATGVARTKRTEWKATVVQTPRAGVLCWRRTDDAAAGLVWIDKSKRFGAEADALADVVFGSFELTGPPRGTHDADARELAERYPAPPKAEEPEQRAAY